MKNNYIPKNKEYLMQLTHSIRVFVNSLRWRAEIFLRPKPTKKQKEKFGFKSTKNAEPVAELKDLEDKLYDLAKNIKFKDASSSFQAKLNKDIRNIKKRF